ncbi:MAG: DUF4149 domain-containing protein [Acidobacteria bacterium]|nr:DUF4149 domain-containing protein [Acidobacteriota bacterium]MBI3656049.1 DUF4149 domain-containing protein [Acidobacteriota bacterium]
MTTVRYLYVLFLAIWLGSMVFFSFVLAPTAFALLPSRDLAGSLVNLSLAKLHNLSYLIALLLMACGAWASKDQSNPIRHFIATNVIVIVMLLVTIGSAQIVSKRIADVRMLLGPIDTVAVTHPLRLEFNRLHEFSVWLMSSTMLLSGAQLFVVLRTLR